MPGSGRRENNKKSSLRQDDPPPAAARMIDDPPPAAARMIDFLPSLTSPRQKKRPPPKTLEDCSNHNSSASPPFEQVQPGGPDPRLRLRRGRIRSRLIIFLEDFLRTSFFAEDHQQPVFSRTEEEHQFFRGRTAILSNRGLFHRRFAVIPDAALQEDVLRIVRALRAEIIAGAGGAGGAGAGGGGGVITSKNCLSIGGNRTSSSFFNDLNSPPRFEKFLSPPPRRRRVKHTFRFVGVEVSAEEEDPIQAADFLWRDPPRGEGSSVRGDNLRGGSSSMRAILGATREPPGSDRRIFSHEVLHHQLLVSEWKSIQKRRRDRSCPARVNYRDRCEELSDPWNTGVEKGRKITMEKTRWRKPPVYFRPVKLLAPVLGGGGKNDARTLVSSPPPSLTLRPNTQDELTNRSFLSAAEQRCGLFAPRWNVFASQNRAEIISITHRGSCATFEPPARKFKQPSVFAKAFLLHDSSVDAVPLDDETSGLFWKQAYAVDVPLETNGLFGILLTNGFSTKMSRFEAMLRMQVGFGRWKGRVCWLEDPAQGGPSLLLDEGDQGEQGPPRQGEGKLWRTIFAAPASAKKKRPQPQGEQEPVPDRSVSGRRAVSGAFRTGALVSDRHDDSDKIRSSSARNPRPPQPSSDTWKQFFERISDDWARAGCHTWSRQRLGRRNFQRGPRTRSFSVFGRDQQRRAQIALIYGTGYLDEGIWAHSMYTSCGSGSGNKKHAQIWAHLGLPGIPPYSGAFRAGAGRVEGRGPVVGVDGGSVGTSSPSRSVSSHSVLFHGSGAGNHLVHVVPRVERTHLQDECSSSPRRCLSAPPAEVAKRSKDLYNDRK